MDYKALLKKYMYYVNDIEGTTFIDDMEQYRNTDVEFKSEEWEELEAINEDLYD